MWSTNFILQNCAIAWTSSFMKFILTNSPKLNPMLKSSHSQDDNVEFQVWIQIWGSNFKGLDLNSYSILDTSVMHHFTP